MFVIAAGLLLDGFRGALQTNIGVGQRRPLLATVQAKPLGESAYFRDVERAARSIPEVAEAAWVSAPPGGWQVSQRLRVEPAQLPLRDVSMHVAAFTKEALAFITLPAIAGRVFGGGDTPDSCRVAVVDDEAATRLFGGEAVGRSIEEPGGRHVEIIGVVRVVPRRPGPTIFYYPAQVADLPGGSGPQIFRVPDRSALAEVVLDATVVSPRYFGLMGWPWMASSGQPGADTEPAHASSWPSAASCRVAVVNQQAASAAFGGRAVGAAVIDGDARRTDIVGVIGARPLGTFHAAIGPAIYLPLAQEAPRRMTLILAAADGAVLDLEAVRQRLDAVPGRAVDPDVPVVVKTLDTHLRHTSLAPLRIATVLVGAFAATALLLGGLGLYGALSEAARQRQRETAMRRALGAKGWRLISHMLDEGGRLAAKGAAAGLLGSVGVSRWLSAIAPVSAAPAAIWLAGPLTLLAMLALASLLPARRAMTVDPLTLLRDS
jgi:hypothetical protein